MSLNSITVDCGPPPVFLNGTVSYQNTTEGSEAHYRCDDGFTLEGEMTAVCRADGRWSSTPVCRPRTGILYNHTHTIALKKLNSVNCSFQFSQYGYSTALSIVKAWVGEMPRAPSVYTETVAHGTMSCDCG